MVRAARARCVAAGRVATGARRAGGVGSAAVQMGLAAGAGHRDRRRTRKVALCRQLGAHHVIDYRAQPDFVDEVRAITNGHGVDVCFDPVGGDVFRKSQRCMAWDGRLLVIGFVAGIAEAPTNHILLKNYSVVGVHWGASLARDPNRLARTAELLLEKAAAGEIDPLVYPPYPMEQGAQALQDLAGPAHLGQGRRTPVLLRLGREIDSHSHALWCIVVACYG